MRREREVIVAAIFLLSAAASGQNIPDIRDSMELAEAPDPLNALIVIPFAAVILILAIAMWLRRRARVRRAAGESPEARAHRRLADLATGEARASYTELHRIFVEYLEGRALIKASRCTTPELIGVLADEGIMSAEWRASVEVFLADCDRAKFSPLGPEREPEAAAAECRALINQVATAPLISLGAGWRA
jgi:hypothetical protein